MGTGPGDALEMKTFNDREKTGEPGQRSDLPYLWAEARGAMLRVPQKGFLFSFMDSWVRIEGDRAFIGISEKFVLENPEITGVLPAGLGQRIDSGDEIAAIQADGADCSVISPTIGSVVEINEKLVADPTILSSDPYESGWIAALSMEEEDDLLDLLMGAEEYLQYAVAKLATVQRMNCPRCGKGFANRYPGNMIDAPSLRRLPPADR